MPATTVAILDRAVAERPDAVALICGAETLTYADYRARVAALATALGDVAGQRVAIRLRNGIEVCVALFAVHAAGATAVPLNPDYTDSELAPMLADAQPVATITHDGLVFAERQRGAPSRVGEHRHSADLADARPGTSLALGDTIATIQFTGGTTGRPKGVMLTHAAIATNVAQREAVLPTDFGDERVLCMMPLYHSFATAMCLHLTAYAAGTLVILPRYRPDWVVEAIAAHRITRLPAGPTVLAGLLDFGIDRAQVASLRCAYSGSAPLPQATLDRWEAATGVPVYEGYGQSEAGPVLTYHGPGMALKLGSVGPALPQTELAIAPGTGEILARGPQVMTGYLNQPEATAAVLKDRGSEPGTGAWLHTGDVGRLDDDGYLYVEDRLKDMAIVGGFNVYPREIDEVLARLPGVREAAAIGVPDAYRGEVVWAYVAGEIDEATVRDQCAAHLVKYKHPARIVFVDALPKTPVGKIDKQALKARAREEMAHVA